MIALSAYCWWRRLQNLIDFLPMCPATFFKDEHTHQWEFSDWSVFKVVHSIPYIVDDKGLCLRMEP